MKLNFKKTCFIFLGVVFGLVFLIYLGAHLLILFLPNSDEIFIGALSNRDTYTTFGDGRFKILEGGKTKSLCDNEGRIFEGKVISSVVIGDVEKYVEENGYVYIVGYFTPWGIQGEDREIYGINPVTREEIYFGDLSNTPRYTVLDTVSGEVKLYRVLDEIPELERKIFEKKVNFWCVFRHDCFEK